MAALLLLLLSALLCSANAREAFNQLPDSYKKGVDLALQQLHSHAGVQHHFLFFRSLMKSDIEVLCNTTNPVLGINVGVFCVERHLYSKQKHGWDVDTVD